MVAPDAIRVLGRPAFHDIVSNISLCLASPALHRPDEHPASSSACPEQMGAVADVSVSSALGQMTRAFQAFPGLLGCMLSCSCQRLFSCVAYACPAYLD